MNQSYLHATLNPAGCKILSFEDYPSNYGSWKISFPLDSILCEVSNNRAGNLLIFFLKVPNTVIDRLKFQLLN
jgi:hypothetical protein